MKRLRILFLIDKVVESGGAERFALGLATHLPRDRFEVWMCSTRAASPVAVAELVQAGVTHVHLGRRAKWDIHRFGALLRLLRRQRFDVLHSHMFGSNVWGTILGRASGVPVIVAHEHNWSYSGDPLRMWIDRRVIGRLATRFVAVSRANQERMVRVEGIPAERIVVLPTAYIPRDLGSGPDIRSALGLAPDSPLIAVAAILRVEKALDVLLDAHAQVIRRFPEAHLVIAGDGPCQDELERSASRLQIGDRVHFLGARLDVDAILRAADVGAMSSDWEGMPLFVFECMAAGTPLVATSVGGVPEVVEDGTTGLLVPARDPTALAGAIAELLSDPQLRERLAVAAAERIDEFTIESVALRFASMYETLVTQAARSGGGPISSVST